MRFCNLTPFLPVSKPISLHPPQPEMMLLVRASYRLTADGTLTELREPREQGPLRTELFSQDERGGECLRADDWVAFKLRAEVLVEGHCYAPGGEAVTQLPIELSVGGWEKRLRVVGQRRWRATTEGRQPSEPEPFVHMPLRYSLAFGGADFPLNPVGMGMTGEGLPCIEYPNDLMLAPSDRPRPAGLGPIHPDWPQRAFKQGRRTGGQGASLSGADEDFDWSFFNAAPEDQQLNGYLRGDEALIVRHLHPDAALVATRLPGLRVRAMAKDDQGELREVPMVLDTLLFDLDERRIHLSWRGFTPARRDDCDDIRTVLVAAEKLNAPRQTLAYYRTRIEAFEAAAPPSVGPADHPLARKVRPSGVMASAQAAAAPSSVGAADHPLARKVRPRGVAPAQPSEGWARGGAPAQPAAVPPPAAPQEVLGPGCDMRERDLSGRDFSGMDLSGACFDAAVLSRTRFRDCNLTGASFRRAILQRADLRGADLRGASLHKINGAFLLAEGANLDEAKLDQANLQDADLCGATLAGASGKEVLFTRAKLTGAIGHGARFPGADLIHADLSGASFEGAVLNDACLEEAQAAALNLTGAQLQSARFGKAQLQDACMAGVRAPSSLWQSAHLDGTDLSQALLSNSDFSRASAQRVDLDGADLREARLYRLDLADASMEDANLFRVDLRKANLQGARMAGANLRDANMLGAKLEGAELRGAELSGATRDR